MNQNPWKSRSVGLACALLLAGLGTGACNLEEPLGGEEPEPVELPTFTLAQLGVLVGGSESQANAGSATLVVGWATDGSAARRAVRFAGGSAVRLPEPAGATSSEARGTNAQGAIVGFAIVAGVSRALLWTSSTAAPVVLPTLGGAEAFARAINTSGVVLGWADDPSGSRIIVFWGADRVVHRLDPVLGEDFTPAGINDDGLAAGGAISGGEEAAFVWDALIGFQEFESLNEDDEEIDVNGLSNSGVVVGGFIASSGQGRAYRWTEARGMVQLGDPPAGYLSVEATSVNDDLLAAGVATAASGNTVPVITTALEPMRAFAALPTLGGAQASPVDGGITGCGVVLGWAFPPGLTTRRAVAWVPPGCSVP